MRDRMDMDDFNFPVVDLTREEEQKMDDDLDYALAYCLQTEFEEESVPDNNSPKLQDVSALYGTSKKQGWNIQNKQKSKGDKEYDADYILALQLQAGFTEENGMKKESLKGNKGRDADFMLALQLQKEFAEKNGMNSSPNSIADGKPEFSNKNIHLVKQKGGKLPSSIVDPEWEVLDPIPDIHSLFLQFNSEFFWGRLEGVEVRWSPRMTLCAGICCYEGRGGLCSVRLSQPLLKYRPRRDLVETLLHEMIHAYLFVTHNNKDHDAHGPEFLKHMNRINQQTGTRISVYHSFHDEVDLHRKHWWKCNGPCQRRSPFFGLVKRAMNRAPSPRDPWWAQHEASCGGTFSKIKEPENFSQKKNLKRKNEAAVGNPGLSDIRTFFPGDSAASKDNQSCNNTEKSVRQPGIPNVHTFSSPVKKTDRNHNTPSIVPFSGKGYTLGSSSSGNHPLDYPARNGSSIYSRLLGTVTKGPAADRSSLSQRKEMSNSQSPVQKKPALGSESRKKQAESLSNLTPNGKGTAVKISSAGGSRTVVIPRNPKPKSSPMEVASGQNKLPEIQFKGGGFTLGSGPRSKDEGSVSPSSIDSPSSSRIGRSNRDLLDTSFDRIFPKGPTKKDSLKSAKTESNFLEKEVSATQSKLNLDLVSPGNKNSDSIKQESDTVIQSNASPHVSCPVCHSLVPDFVINTHLDTCLKDFS